MALIAFSDDKAWVKAGWAVSRVLSDMTLVAGGDESVQRALTTATYTNCLQFDFIDAEVYDDLLAVLRRTIRATLDESDSRLTWKDGLDEEARIGYLRAMQQLWEMLPTENAT